MRRATAGASPVSASAGAAIPRWRPARAGAAAYSSRFRRHPSPIPEFDRFDLALLRLLQADARQSSETLGAAVGLSASAVQRRLKQLRESGAIRGEVALLDPAQLGRPITVIDQVVLERGRADIVDDFARAVNALGEVQRCYHVTGEYDFVLVLSLRDMDEYQRLTRRLFYGNPNIQRFQTSVAIDTLKAGLQIPL